MAEQKKSAIYVNDEGWKTVKRNLDQVISLAKVQYMKEVGEDNFSNTKFERWLADSFFKVDYNYWRHMRDGNKPFSKPFIENVEKANELPPGFLKNEKPREVANRQHFFDTSLFVRQYLFNNDMSLEPEIEVKLLKLVYSHSLENGEFSNEALKRFLDVLL